MVGVNPIAFIANFLDPRWKLLALELSDEDRDTIKNDVLEMMKEIFQAKHPVLQHPIDTSNDNSLEVTPMSPTTASIQAAMDAEEARLGTTDEASGELMATLRQEMDQYLSKRRLTMTKDSNPLSWWKDNHRLFPNLAAIAKQYLAVQASSASSERMFSKANILIDWKRSRMDPQIVTRVMFLLGNLETFQEKMAEVETNNSE